MQGDSHSKRFLAVWGAAWLALFAVSLPWQAPEFRAWEHLYDPDTRRFEPNQRVAMEVVGDLGWKSWVRELQDPRPTTFSVDRFGFRNPDRTAPPRYVVIGDSYAAGAGLSDDETLAARLSQEVGEPVYNFATQYLNGPALFFREARFAESPPEVVVWSPVARAIRPRPLFVKGLEQRRPNGLAGIGDDFAALVRRVEEGNRLRRELRFVQQGIQFRRRGHRYARTLPGGETVLALSLAEQGLLVPPHVRGVAACVAMLTQLHAVLAGAGVRFVFAPIPEVGSIYPELYDPRERAFLADPSFLDVLLEGAQSAGVPVMDLRPVFRASREPYLYQRDDTHWGPRAVELAARALAPRLTLEVASPRDR